MSDFDQCKCSITHLLFRFLTSAMFLGDAAGGAWRRLSRVAISSAEYDSSERLPHPKCLPSTRVKLLDNSYGFLDDTEKSRIVWVHGTAGVGKSAVAFTVAERMRDLKTDEKKLNERRLSGTFFSCVVMQIVPPQDICNTCLSTCQKLP